MTFLILRTVYENGFSVFGLDFIFILIIHGIIYQKNNLTKNPKQLNCVNLNDSDLKQLDALPGVGPVLAQRILDYRETNGRFAEVSQLSNVEGIGKSKLKTISEKACV